MAKPLKNNKIIYQNINGRVAQHDIWLDQGVTISDSPTFSNIQITGDAVIEGNLYVEGNTTILDTNVIEFEDNIFLINRNESGSGVTLNQAGMEVERGLLENYRIVYDETKGTMVIGEISNLQKVATREDNPLDNTIMIWNEATQRMDGRDYISIPTTFLEKVNFSETSNAINATTASIKIAGGVGILGDTYTDGRIYIKGGGDNTLLYTNSQDDFIIVAPQDINIYTNDTLNLTGNLTVSGDFTVNGTFTYINSEVVTIEDNMIVVNSYSYPNIDSGFLVDTGMTTSNKYAGLIYKGINNEFALGFLATEGSTVSISDYVGLKGQRISLVDTTDANGTFSSGSLRCLGGGFIEKSLYVGGSITVGSMAINKLSITSTESSTSKTTGALIVAGGVSINSTENAVNSTNGGGLTVLGGLGVNKDVHIGGDLNVNKIINETSSNLVINTNIPIINGVENVNYSGILVKRSQSENDILSGEVIKDNPIDTDVIPDQSGILSNQVKLTNSKNSNDDYYNGWWVVKGTEVRQIVDYIGTSKVCVLKSNWTIQPVENDIVSLYNSAYITQLYNENSSMVEIKGVALNNVEINTSGNSYIGINTGGLNVYSSASSDNLTSGSIYTEGGVSINNSSNASSVSAGGCLTIGGGVGIKKDMYIEGNINIGDNSNSTIEGIKIKKEEPLIELEKTSLTGGSSITFREYIDKSGYSIEHKNDLINVSKLVNLTSGSKIISINSVGNISVGGDNQTINNVISVRDNSFIGTFSSGYVGLIGCNDPVDSNINSGRIKVYNNNVNNGDVTIYSGSVGGIKFYNNEILSGEWRNDGVLRVLTNVPSLNSTTGSIITDGGIVIKNTSNATSVTNGGGLLVEGGCGILKDVFIGGDLNVLGNVNFNGAITKNSLTVSNTVGTSVIDGEYTSLKIGNECYLSGYIETIPVIGSDSCSFEIDLPEKINNVIKRSEVRGNCSGYVDDTELISLFNTICVGVNGSKKAIVKFQSVNTGVHYLQFYIQYTI